MKFLYKGQQLDIEVLLRMAKRIVDPTIPIEERRAIIATVKDPRYFNQETHDYIETLVYMRAIGSCNAATNKPKPTDPINLFELSTLIHLAFEQFDEKSS